MAKGLKAILIIAIVLNAGCMAGVKKQDSQSVETLMVKSGLDKQLEQIGPMFQTGIMQQHQTSKTLSEEEVNDLIAMALTAFDPAALKQTVRKHVQANLPPADMQAALTWLDSPLGKKITRLEEESSTPEGYAQMQKMAGSLAGNVDRVNLMRKLDKATKATESGVAVMMGIQRAIIAALVSAAAPRDKRPNMDVFDKEMERYKEQIQSAVEQSTIMSMLYTYRSLSDAEIGKYIEFADSAAGKKYHAVTADAVKAAVTNGAQVLGDLMTQNAAKKSQGSPGQRVI